MRVGSSLRPGVGAAPRLHVAPRVGVRARATPPEVTEKAKAPATAPSKAPSSPPPPPPPEDDKEVVVGRSVVELVLDQVLDSATDVARHVSRQLLPKPDAIATDRLVMDGSGRMRLSKAKPVVCILGSGWGAHSCMKVIDTDVYEVVMVSPRNHFLFTPMLPSTAVGTVEFRSLLEPIRTANEFVTYLEATCDAVDLERKVATCTSAFQDSEGRRPTFEIPYDVLVVSVGEKPATFGVPGVAENAYFMKEITDTVRLRNRIGECFELACLPGTTEEERRRLLNFVVVGGGPTGVEFAGTLSDFVRNDLKRKYPSLMKYVSVTLLQSAQSILTQFDSSLAARAMESMKSVGIDIKLGVRVVEITPKQVVLKDGTRIDYGVCVWSAGNSSRPLVQQLVEALPTQKSLQPNAGPKAVKLVVDRYLRVAGARDVLALGDCSRVWADPLPTTAQVAGQQGAYVAHLVNSGHHIGLGGPGKRPPARPAIDLFKALQGKQEASPPSSLNTYEQLAAKVEAPGAKVDTYKRPFEFLSLGMLAYVGDDKALTQIEAGRDTDMSLRLSGRLAFLVWRAVYITKQVSFRNRVLILLDWMKTQVFGRDLSLF